MAQVLKLHPDSRSGAVTGIAVDVTRPEPDRLVFTYVTIGAIARVRLPPVVDSARADELWQHTCFEAFLRDAPGEAYTEFNFAPSTLWAAYRFIGTRRGMSPLREISPPRIAIKATTDTLTVTASLLLDAGAGLPRDAHWRLGLSAVIEEVDGHKSYWALAHPPGRADFHHPDCFAYELPRA